LRRAEKRRGITKESQTISLHCQKTYPSEWANKAGE